jgi:hypothetical protein
VQKRKIIVVMAMLLIASLLLALAPGASAQRPLGRNMPGNVDEMYATIAITGMNNDSVSYIVLNTAVKGRDGKVAIENPSQPLAVTYYFSNDTAAFPDRKRLGGAWPKPALTAYDNATINTAGASAVIAMKNITTSRGLGGIESAFTGLSVYLPDGSVKSYSLKTPARFLTSRVAGSVTLIANPEYRSCMQDALKGGAKFPANAPAVPLKKIDAGA